MKMAIILLLIAVSTTYASQVPGLCANLTAGGSTPLIFPGNSRVSNIALSADCLLSMTFTYTSSESISNDTCSLCGVGCPTCVSSCPTCDFSATASGTLSMQLDLCALQVVASGSVALSLTIPNTGGVLSMFTNPAPQTVKITSTLGLTDLAVPIAGIATAATGPFQVILGVSPNSGFSTVNGVFQIGFLLTTHIETGNINISPKPSFLNDQIIWRSGMISFTGITNVSKVCAPPTPPPSGRCFPGTASLQLKNGKKIKMEDLQIDHEVQVSIDTYSEVYMFSHRRTDTISIFIQLVTLNGILELSPDHYLYVNGQAVPAHTVKIGDNLTSINGLSSIIDIKSIEARGLYNPHTLHGDIMINGFLTTTYTESILPDLAHAILAPIRALYRMNISFRSD